MASTFTLTLDTTGPQGATFSINAGATYTVAVAVTGNFFTSDSPTTGYQIKIWGADIQGGSATEGGATWVSYTTALSITLTSGDGLKTINAKIRDDVGNETAILSDTITLDTISPVVSISTAFSPVKISKVATFDTSTGSFQSDTAIQAWKVKVVSSTGAIHSSGTTIPTTAGSTNTTGGTPDSGVQILAATTNQSVSIKGTDVETASAGDATKTVKIFVQDLAGNWSVAP